MARKKQYNAIPVVLSEKEFNEFILPHLKRGSRGPNKKISYLYFVTLKNRDKSKEICNYK